MVAVELTGGTMAQTAVTYEEHKPKEATPDDNVLLDAVNGREVPVSVRDGYATVAACIAADQAAATGCVVKPDSTFEE